MIKWEEPMLISLEDAPQAQGNCEPTGSGDTNICRNGSYAGAKCHTNGTSPGGVCLSVGSGFED